MVNSRNFMDFLKWKAVSMSWYIRVGIVSSLVTLILLIVIVQKIQILNRYEQTRYSAELALAPKTKTGAEDSFFVNLPEFNQSEKIAAHILQTADGMGLMFQHAEFSSSTDAKAHMMRYRIKLPLKGNYLQIRHFLSAILEAQPSLAIDQLQFKRNDAFTDLVEANLAMSVYFREGTNQ